MTVAWYPTSVQPERIAQAPQRILVLFNNKEAGCIEIGSAFFLGDSTWLVEGKLFPTSSIFGWTHLPDMPELPRCPVSGEVLPIAKTFPD